MILCCLLLMRCSGLEAGRHKDFQWRSLFCLLLAPIHHQTFPRQRARRVLGEHWNAKDVCPIIPPLTGSLTLLLAPQVLAVGQCLQKKKKNNNNNSNRLNYLSCTGDRSRSVASFNSLWSRYTKLRHPEIKWGSVTTRFTPVAPEGGTGAHANHCLRGSPGGCGEPTAVPHGAASPV